MNTQLTEDQKKAEIERLYAEKRALLDEYGIFGGGQYVNQLHQQINRKLEALGIDPNS